MKDLIFRQSFKEDNNLILDLINLVQPHMPWSMDHFEWQYLKNPAGKAKIWVAEHNGIIIANYSAIPHFFKMGKREGIAWMVQDILTHPDFRGLGIMDKLATLCNESICNKDFPVNYTFPNELSNSHFLRHGWRKAYRIPLRIITDLPDKLENIQDNFDTTVPVSSFQQDVNDLWNKSKNDFPFAVSRTSPYLTWRYFNKPKAQYFPFAEIQDRALKGLIIMKYHDQKESHRIAHICDLFAIPDNKKVLNNLLIGALKFAIDMNAEKLTAWLPPGHPYEEMYDSLGFTIDNSINRWVLVNVEENFTEYVGAAKSENWHLSMGDSDVY